MTLKIAPSLLSADFAALGQAARDCEDAGAEYLHFDVMDNQFVPNLTFGAPVIAAIRPHSGAVFDAHLMVVHPETLIAAVARAGADVITVQAEACTHLQRVLRQIRDCGARAGVALNPSTPLTVLDYVLADDVDLLLIMTVNPGFGGQSFIPSMFRKLREARAMVDACCRDIELQVDGGVGPDNVRGVADAGCTVTVAGSSVFGHAGGPRAGITALRDALAVG
jgi:ribulose-phosphate 3-epimerase